MAGWVSHWQSSPRFSPRSPLLSNVCSIELYPERQHSVQTQRPQGLEGRAQTQHRVPVRPRTQGNTAAGGDTPGAHHWLFTFRKAYLITTQNESRQVVCGGLGGVQHHRIHPYPRDVSASTESHLSRRRDQICLPIHVGMAGQLTGRPFILEREENIRPQAGTYLDCLRIS